MAEILIVDDEKRMGELLREELEDAGLRVDVDSSGAAALARLRSHTYRIVITDVRMAPPDGMEILRAVKERTPQTDVVMMTAYSSVQSAREAFKLGASDYVIKPFDLEEMRIVIEGILDRQRLAEQNDALVRENRELRDQLVGKGTSSIVGESAAVQELRRLIDLVSSSDATVLVKGASGSGKELVAREIHLRSGRADKPFVAVNCAAIPDTLLESELFGHEKGAFTSADARKPGRFELAQGGTIFLDEIGEMGAEVQAKMLRVLEEREITRLGGTTPIDVDIRVVAATNRNLEHAIRGGAFREDLYYRLNVFPIEVPSLAARRDDIPLLVGFFLREMRYPHPQVAPEAWAELRAYDWPGNVRELRNLVERATILAQGQALESTHLTPPSAGSGAPREIAPGIELPDVGIDLEALEANLIRKALAKTSNNKTQAARLLGMTRRTLYSRMEKHGIPVR
ncbi:MAG: sigma-54-dependent Fis family transcriptional regulator [Candidatus Latescibacterota bacterium]|nr:MAG: sigma-54-dependent Fis family transcriptional regulator [Candidatus Latescibacterota bacterium]